MTDTKLLFTYLVILGTSIFFVGLGGATIFLTDDIRNDIQSDNLSLECEDGDDGILAAIIPDGMECFFHNVGIFIKLLAVSSTLLAVSLIITAPITIVLFWIIIKTIRGV